MPADSIRRRWLLSTRRRRTAFIALAVLFGVLCGLGSFTFGYGEGASYFSNDPNACANCHVMHGHFDSWQKSSHHHVAVCNDCHLPHDPIGKWVVKADNGFFHSWAFTFETYPEVIQIKPRNRIVTESTCIDCHRDFVHEIAIAPSGTEAQSCVRCHSDVGHALR